MAPPASRSFLRDAIPASLRTFIGTGRYDATELRGGQWLVWNEPAGDRLAVVFQASHDGGRTFVEVLTGTTVCERREAVDPYDVPVSSKRQPSALDEAYAPRGLWRPRSSSRTPGSSPAP
jgi:hypothetical protein